MALAGRGKVFQTNSLRRISKGEKADLTSVTELRKLSKQQGGLIVPVFRLCHPMTDRLSSQMGHTKLSSEMY